VKVLQAADEQPFGESGAVAALHALQRVSSHPYLVDVLDAGVHDGRAYLVMPYLEGGTLADRVAASGPIPLTEVVAVVADVAAALEYAHENGVLHLNVHPGNVFRLADNKHVLADTGVAMLARLALGSGDADAPGASGSGSTAGEAGAAEVGPASWLAPELISGRSFSAASDVYGLAWTTHRLLGLDGSAARAPRLVLETIQRGMGPTLLERQHSVGSYAAELARAAGSASPMSLLPAVVPPTSGAIAMDPDPAACVPDTFSEAEEPGAVDGIDEIRATSKTSEAGVPDGAGTADEAGRS
jgi:serine/threonine protein kinase